MDGFLCILLFLVLLVMFKQLPDWCAGYLLYPLKCLPLFLESCHRILILRLGIKHLKIEMKGNLSMLLHLILIKLLERSENTCENLTAH